MIEIWDPADPHRRVRCQTHSRFGAPCVRYQDHPGTHYYGYRSAQSRHLAPRPTGNAPDRSEGA